MKVTEIGVPDAAFRLGAKYHRTLDFVLSGRLVGRKDESGRWLVTLASVDTLKRELAGEKADSPPIDLGSFRRSPEPAA